MQLKRNVLVETLPKLADKEVAKHNKLENIDGKWFLSKLGLNLIKNQTYLMNLWQHLSLTLEKISPLRCYIRLSRFCHLLSLKDSTFHTASYLEIYGKWYLSKLGHNLNKTQTYLMTVWQHLSLTLEKKWIPSIKDASVTLTTYLEPKFHYLTDKSIEVLYSAKQVLTPDLIQRFDVSYYYLDQKWIPSIKDASVTLTTNLEPKFRYLTDKSIEGLYTVKQVLTPDLIQGFDVSNYYLEVNRIMTIAKLHLKKKVQVSFESCTKNVWHGFKKLVNLGRKKIRKVTQRAFSSG
ncbi:hypothetical protein F2Q70_00010301 [Brassica cretica]|uniref:Uncharacterized protein n=1 Tax=Brassica cretica TaxID=69181 RepID=A0A8S9M551_BRACR|nr:hypothetical protein F2Q70_00010301 [Brassica cretica]